MPSCISVLWYLGFSVFENKMSICDFYYSSWKLWVTFPSWNLRGLLIIVLYLLSKYYEYSLSSFTETLIFKEVFSSYKIVFLAIKINIILRHKLFSFTWCTETVVTQDWQKMFHSCFLSVRNFSLCPQNKLYLWVLKQTSNLTLLSITETVLKSI